VDGVNDLGRVYTLEVGAGHSEVRVTELALDDRERDPFAGHLDDVNVPELMRCEPSANPGHLREPS
jgi:hypothetical protein